jgi:hypothetical protein
MCNKESHFDYLLSQVVKQTQTKRMTSDRNSQELGEDLPQFPDNSFSCKSVSNLPRPPTEIMKNRSWQSEGGGILSTLKQIDEKPEDERCSEEQEELLEHQRFLFKKQLYEFNHGNFEKAARADAVSIVRFIFSSYGVRTSDMYSVLSLLYSFCIQTLCRLFRLRFITIRRHIMIIFTRSVYFATMTESNGLIIVAI